MFIYWIEEKIRRIICAMQGHDYKEKGDYIVGVLEIYHVNECSHCGHKILGDIFYTDDFNKGQQ